MKSITQIGIALVASAMMLTSCVSSKKYTQLEEDYKELQAENQELKALAKKTLLENELMKQEQDAN